MSTPAAYTPAVALPIPDLEKALAPQPAGGSYDPAESQPLTSEQEASLALFMARNRLLDESRWARADYFERQRMCRDAQAELHHPDVMRYRAIEAAGLFKTTDRRTKDRLAKRMQRAKASCSKSMLAYYADCALERALHGWGRQGDEAVGRVPLPPDNSEREDLVQQLVAERRRLLDPNPGARTELARAERDRVRAINAEVKARIEAIDEQAKEAARAEKATAKQYRELLADQHATPQERRSAERYLREKRCRERYKKSYAERAVDDLVLIYKTGRTYPSAQGLNPFKIQWAYVKTFAHSKRGDIDPPPRIDT